MTKFPFLMMLICILMQGVGFGDPTTPIPINFYGKVIDENNKPVPGASVSVQVIKLGDPYDDSGVFKVTTDGEGLFSLTGKTGLGVGVTVFKSGYYTPTSEEGKSWLPTAENGTPLPSKDNPAIWRLRTRGVAEPLKELHVGAVTQKPDGTLKKVDLITGKIDQASSQVTVEITSDKSHIDASGHFDWRYTLTVPGGGMQPRTGEFDFTAPSNGYKESVSQSFSVASGGPWYGSTQKQFFLKLADGRFARGEFIINAGNTANDPPFWSYSGYLNPTGSPNLEWDPAKVAH